MLPLRPVFSLSDRPSEAVETLMGVSVFWTKVFRSSANGSHTTTRRGVWWSRFSPRVTPPPGFGHRFHTRDPRAARLLQLALELELEGRYVQLIRSVERILAERSAASGEPPVPVNADGVIAAVCGDLGLTAESASVLFMVSRLPGIVAHAIEEQQRQPPMRLIDPSDYVYDGPGERRLPETRR